MTRPPTPWPVLATTIPQRATTWLTRATTGAPVTAIRVSPDTIGPVRAAAGILDETTECMHRRGRSCRGRSPAPTKLPIAMRPMAGQILDLLPVFGGEARGVLTDLVVRRLDSLRQIDRVGDHPPYLCSGSTK